MGHIDHFYDTFMLFFFFFGALPHILLKYMKYMSFLKTTTNSSCVCTHLANKADSDSDSDSDTTITMRENIQ